ncbi:SNF2-related protein [Croceimicrobium hydrocarbonivorans]|uniref:DEAD/DEAH box helicase family protein n=1 Tax=Croceimicrobium hydrocarbonivorans TaxID=2761580 RepID=A0A7H0VEK9_9FLAO|nr:SNF2-related protein [Croceimicrobium hydrocarbonivorans]QNR24157.1 DEAD/DEAH box helicase family protein [Croceimicrobium hydrocarbonivorans]
MRDAPNKREENSQFTLDFEKPIEPYTRWPLQEVFPLNIEEVNKRVGDILMGDLTVAKEFILLTGYTSLSQLIDTFGKDDYNNIRVIRIVLGFDPNFRGRKRYHIKPLDKEIKEYWLKKGLSILQGGSVINLIEKIKSHRVQVRFFNKLHAKIYVSHKMAMLGSSNFSNNGLLKQTEANYRVLMDDHPSVHEDIKLIAENYFKKATPYHDIIDLLENLIKPVGWKEALARAIHEVIEGGWLSDFGMLSSKLENVKLWPTQKRGLAQALSILQENANVLIADPTGAGKTKMCSTIILALKNWLWENGRKEMDNSVIVCPPLVIDKWKKEFKGLATISNNQISNGTLSNGKLKSLRDAEEDLNLANILAVDEAHNYLNIKSKRSVAIRKNNADYKVLITATPINKKIDDLLKIVELLDVDNLDDESFESFRKLKARPDLRQEDDIKNLKQFISRFTVRRTKSEINKQIDQEPHLYKNALGDTCKFPEQIPVPYQTNETKADQDIAQKINELCANLKGISYLKQINNSNFFISEDEKQAYIDRRFLAAKHLSIYMIRYRLRSSKMALIEHILGAGDALKIENFEYKKKQFNKVKNKILDSFIDRNAKPRISNDFKNCDFPNWFTNIDEYIQACKEEKALYLQIANLAKQLSNEREKGKAKLLIEQLNKHQKVIAFDSCLITLNYLKYLIKKHSPKTKVLLATGETERESDEVLDKFHLLSENEERIIALCSDKMSEGVDLQKASAVTLLDLPSVIRIVEQRFGRVDRMDTPYSKIEMYWPDDTEVFSLNGDKKLLELNDLVHSTIGSNFKIPDQLKFKHFKKSESIKEIIEEFKDYEKADDSWEGITDSFRSIVNLKEGENALLTTQEYNELRNVNVSLKTGVSFVDSSEEWCFIALNGDKHHSPKWYFIEPKQSQSIHTDFPVICDLLKKYLQNKKQFDIEWSDHYLSKYIQLLKDNELELLSPKKKRAIRVAEQILEKRSKQRNISEEERIIIKKLLRLFDRNESHIDIEAFSKTWIDFLQPYIDDKRSRNKDRRKVFNLHDLITPNEIRKIDFNIEILTAIYEEAPVYEEIDLKIASCIVGVPT